jgi:mRNA interferase RelE/StbE
MKYNVLYSKKSQKQLSKFDKQISKKISNWISLNLVDCTDPRAHGKELGGDMRGLWRYRVGDYRIVADIQDDKVIILIVDIDHRRNIYRK